MQVKIIFNDSTGGVKTVSESLQKAFNSNAIDSRLINLNNYKGTFLIKSYRSLRSLFKFKKNNVLILQHFYPIFLGLFLRYCGYKSIINVVHIDLVKYYNSIGFFKKCIINFMFLMLKNKAVVFVSKEAEVKAKDKFKLKKTFTIYNIYDFSNISSDRKKISPNNIVIGSISRLHSIKNIDLLMRVVRKIRIDNPNIELIIYGDGPEKEKLKKYIEYLDCSDFIHLAGKSNNKNKMYSSIDAMVSFSSIEGLPTTILESISYGVPVFYTDCSSGPRELMAPNSNPVIKTKKFEKTNVGYLVKPVIDTATYAEKLTNYEQEYVSILKSFINDMLKDNFNMKFDISPFSKKTVVQNWLKIIDENKFY